MAEAEKVNRIERRKLEFRDKITEAAIKLFEIHGVEETSVASIIIEADIAHKTFFNHFPTKNDLLQHIVTSFSGQAYDIFYKDFEEQPNPRQRLEYCMVTIGDTLSNVKPHYKQLLNLYLFSGAGAGDLRNEQKEQFTELVSQIFSAADAEGILHEDLSIEDYTEATVGLCLATLLNWSLEEDYDVREKMKGIFRFINSSMAT